MNMVLKSVELSPSEFSINYIRCLDFLTVTKENIPVIYINAEVVRLQLIPFITRNFLFCWYDQHTNYKQWNPQALVPSHDISKPQKLILWLQQ